MAMLLGLVRPTAGTAPCSARSIDDPAAYLPRVGALIESPAFYPSLTGAENLRVFATVGGHDADRIPALLELVGLDGRGDDRYRSYSLGMKQRLGIAAALLGDPELLILDEPANGLDPQGVREMRTLVGAAGRHRPHRAGVVPRPQRARAGVRLAGADRHRPLALPGPDPSDLLDGVGGGLAVVPRAARRPITRCATCSSPRGHRGRAVATTGSWSASTAPTPADVAAAVNRAAFDAGIVLVELSPLRTTLEDRYLSMVQGGAR